MRLGTCSAALGAPAAGRAAARRPPVRSGARRRGRGHAVLRRPGHGDASLPGGGGDLGGQERQQRQGRARARAQQRALFRLSRSFGPPRLQHRRPADRRDLAERARGRAGRSGPADRARGAGTAPAGDRRQQHGRRPPGRDALVHRCGHALLPQGPAGQIWRAGAGDLGRARRHRAHDPGGRARRRPTRPLGPRVPGPGLRGADLQRARVDQRLWRRHDRRPRGPDHGRQSGRGAGARRGRRLGRDDRAAQGHPVPRGGRADHLRARQRGLHAQLALCLVAAAGGGQPAQGQGRRSHPCPRAAPTAATAPRSAAGSSRSRSIRRTRRRRSIWCAI